MTASIYYPQSARPLKDIALDFCSNPASANEFTDKVLRTNLSLGLKSETVPNRPVIIPNTENSSAPTLTELTCCSLQQHATLANLSHYAGGSAVIGLASLLWDTRIPEVVGNLNTFGGNGMGAAMASSNAILKAVNEYDLANKHYEDLRNHRASPRMVHAAKLRAEAAFRKMNQVFGIKSVNYLNTNTFNTRPAVNAAGRQVWESIPVRNTLDVQKLASFAKVGRIVMPGVILLDGYIRANSVYHSWRNSDPSWKKQAVVQSAAFSVGLLAAGLISTVIVASPFGLIIGLVVGGTVAVTTDHVMTDFIDSIYDWVAQ